MSVGMTDTITLLGLRTRKLQLFRPVFLDLFFPQEMTFDTQEIAFDQIETDVVLAPLVSPMVNGKVIASKGAKLSKFQPAYVKPKHRVDPTKTLKRLPGEAIGGSFTPAERRSIARTMIVNEHEDMILHREEWLASQAIWFGKVKLESSEYETQVVDFERDAKNTILAEAGSKWSEVDKATYDPTDDFEMMAEQSSDICQTVIMDKLAWSNFRKFKVVREMLKTDSGSKTKGEIGPRAEDIFQFKMTFGDFDIWVYDGKYKDEKGNRMKFAPDHGVLFCPTPSTCRGTRAYGAIMDLQAQDSGLVAASRWPKTIITDEPSAEYIVTHSAPLIIPDDANRYVYFNAEGIAPTL